MRACKRQVNQGSSLTLSGPSVHQSELFVRSRGARGCVNMRFVICPAPIYGNLPENTGAVHDSAPAVNYREPRPYVLLEMPTWWVGKLVNQKTRLHQALSGILMLIFILVNRVSQSRPNHAINAPRSTLPESLPTLFFVAPPS